MPVNAPTVAILGERLVHVPPAGVEDKVEVHPTSIKNVPEIAAGLAFIVTTTEVGVGVPHFVIVAVPGAMPVIIALIVVDAVTAAIAGSLLLHVPPVEGVSVNVVVLPTQTESVPQIAENDEVDRNNPTMVIVRVNSFFIKSILDKFSLALHPDNTRLFTMTYYIV